jgi:ankyrin repeat protein
MQDIRGVTPIMVYAANGKLKAIKLLIKHGANIRIKNKRNENILFYSVECPEILKFFLKNNFDPNSCNKNNATPLFVACHTGNIDAVNTLLLAGSNINHYDIHGFTPLYYAIKKSHIDIVKLLLDKGAKVNKLIKNKNGQTYSLLDFAIRAKKLKYQSQIIVLLKKYGVGEQRAPDDENTNKY